MPVIDSIGQTWFSVGAVKGRVMEPVIYGAGIGARCVWKSSFVKGSPPKTGLAG